MTKANVKFRWPIFLGNSEPHERIRHLPPAPPWRRYLGEPDLEPSLDENLARQSVRSQQRGRVFYFREGNDAIQQKVNAALFLRRPLLVTGKPGTGKSSLAHAVAYELKLGPVLEWPITSHSTLQDALYRYDAIGRLQEATLREDDGAGRPSPSPDQRSPWQGSDIGRYVRLGPLGTALLPTKYPRVLLIDEIDKSDIDLPNDLLYVFEEGAYEIPELARLAERHKTIRVLSYDSDESVRINEGKVRCAEFPFIVMTSNGERELPPAFLRRCIQVEIDEPNPDDLARIVSNHFRDLDQETHSTIMRLVRRFDEQRKLGDLATDQLLNAVYLAAHGIDISKEFEVLGRTVFRNLSHFRSE